jgi:hypothetical protein
MQKLASVVRWLEAHGPDLLLWVIWGCVIFNGSNAIAEYTNAHDLFPKPWGGYAMAITVDGLLVYAFLTFRRSPWMGGVLLVAAAVTTYMLQRWHAIMVGVDDRRGMATLVVAGIVPGAMVLVTFAWHLIRNRKAATERVHNLEGLEVVELPPEAVRNMEGIQERKDRDLPDRSLAAERPTEAAPVTSRSPAPNGAGSPRQRAMHVLREHPTLTVAAAAAAAGVSERTVRNAKADLMGERGI